VAGTRWVRLDVDYFQNPKILAAPYDAVVLHLASICWCASQLTDGHIPVTAVPLLCSQAKVSRRAVTRAVTAGLWISTGGGDYYVKDYLDYQQSRGDVEAERERWRLRQQRKRDRDAETDVTP
jgi:hypothetical protein